MGRFKVAPRLSVAIFLILVLATNAIASAVPKRTKVYPLQEYLEESGDIEGQDYYGPVVGYPSKQTRRSLDSLSGATFGENKRFVLPRDVPASMNLRPSNVFDRFVKRNIDEIDRTAFDSFFKRNLDEIDRVGWSGFVKRLDNYLVNRQTH